MMEALTARSRSLAAAVIFISVFVFVELRGVRHGGFRIDEAHKISETVYLRLVEEGRFSDPLWFTHVVDRTNPPFGKYFLGLFIQLHGLTLPERPSLAVTSGTEWYIPPNFDRSLTRAYQPLLIAARRASTFCFAATAAIIAYLLLEHAKRAVAAVVAIVLFLAQFLTHAFAATAVFDPILMLLVTTSLLLWSMRWERKNAILLDGALGLAAALAFQTRVIGALLLVFGLGAIGAAAIRHRRPFLRATLAGAAVAVATFFIVATSINPYYWSSAPDDPRIPASFRENEPLPVRIVARYVAQYRDARTLLRNVRTVTRGFRSPADKIRWITEAGFGDPAGIVVLAGVAAGAVIAPIRRRMVNRELAFLGAASLLFAVVYLIWLPVAWPRYLLPVLPMFVLLSAAGWSMAGSFLAEGTHRAADPRP